LSFFFALFVFFVLGYREGAKARRGNFALVLKFEGLDLPPASLEPAESAEKNSWDFLCALCELLR
jgi:hypothetical protein